jgi:hypothetical protein
MQNSGFSAEYVFIHHMKEQATQNFQCIWQKHRKLWKINLVKVVNKYF